MQLGKADSVRLYKIRKAISELSSKEGRGTELVSLYIPPKKPIHEVVAYLRNEWGTAGNIKSDTTRNHVQDALTKTMQRLKLYRETPENGLVIFSGALPTNGPGSEVVRINEIVPPKPVPNFTYTCVSPDTKILLDDGTQKAIGALQNCWTDYRVMSCDTQDRKLVRSSIENYLSTPVEGRKTYCLTVESGRKIIATADHPFHTPRGWIRLEHLKPGDFVSVLPLADLDSSKVRPSGSSSDKMILDEKMLRSVSFPPKNLRLAIRRLKERGLLPLTQQNPRLPVIARLLGHIFSDGSLSRTVENRRGGPYSYYTIDLCTGNKADEDELREDVATLGYTVPNGREVTYTMQVDGRTYTARTRHGKLRDSAICTLLRALGAPVGSKVKNGVRIPLWLTEASSTVQREFLATYLGGDGTAPLISGRNPSSQMGVIFHRILQKTEEGLKFADELSQLLANFGVVVNAINCAPSYRRKDGYETVEIAVRFKLSEDNVLKICHGIGFRYCSRKMLKANLVGEYLRIKSYVRKEVKEKMVQAQEMRSQGMEIKQIGSLLAVTQRTAEQWAQGMVENPNTATAGLPTFTEWASAAKNDLAEPLLWEGIVSIEPVHIADVRDLTVANESHSFFANGFLVHNCDDHYHLDQLKDMLKEEKVYGILAIDSTEAGIGILSGDRMDIEDVVTSGVSGKTRKGGQCVSSDTLVQLEDGRLVPISFTSPGSRIASYNFVNHTNGTYECTDTFTLVPKEYYQIETARPKMNISATGEHRFFTLTSGGVSTLEASKLKVGDKILASRRLPEPADSVLSTRFPAEYSYLVSPKGRRLLLELRQKRRLSQKKLASIIGLYQTEISQLERGERNLEWVKLRRIIRFLSGNVDEFLAKHVEAKRTLPEHFTNELLQILGYIAGDGNVDGNRVTLYEYRIQVAKKYSNLARLCLNLKYAPIKQVDKRGKPGSFARHRYLETRIYCKEFTDALRQYYPGLISTKSREIPEQIHRLDNAHLAPFLRGVFDAEGHAREGRRIGIAMKAGLFIRQLQLLLLRFGIVSSYSKHINRYGSIIHALDVSDYSSLEAFYKSIGFSATDKQERLRRGIAKRQAHSYLSVPVIGSWVDKRAKELGIRRRQFSGITNFFHDERGISRRGFRRVVQTFEEELTFARSSRASTEKLQLLEETVSGLSMIEQSELILVRVKKVQRVDNLGKEKFVDIELPMTRSFIGNGLVLHNSARRYERARDMELTYYYHRVGDHATRIFVNDNHVAGIIVGGPGPTKEDFLKGGYLHYQLQKNLLAVLDTGYSGREGVREMVGKAADILHDVRLVEEKKLVQRFLSEVNKPGGLAIYALPRVMDAISKANVETVLVSDDIETTQIKLTCKNCSTVQERMVPNQKKMQTMQEMISKPCPKCSSTDYEIDETDVIDILEEKATQASAKVEVISSGTEEGNMFKSFGGVGAFLRYRG